MFSARPAMEDKKATRLIVRLAIRRSMPVAWTQTLNSRCLKTRRNKSHSPRRFRGLRRNENINSLCFIGQPNSNLLTLSGFFSFHRGLPFPSTFFTLLLWEYTCVQTYALILAHICFHAHVVVTSLCWRLGSDLLSSRSFLCLPSRAADSKRVYSQNVGWSKHVFAHLYPCLHTLSVDAWNHSNRSTIIPIA